MSKRKQMQWILCLQGWSHSEASFSVCRCRLTVALHSLPSVCVDVLISSSYRDIRYIGLGLALVSHLIASWNNISKYAYILRSWGLSLQHMNLEGGDTIWPITRVHDVSGGIWKSIEWRETYVGVGSVTRWTRDDEEPDTKLLVSHRPTVIICS